LGSTVEYASVDVRDASAMSGLLTSWTRKHGPLAGFVHGAGVIQDKLIRDKTPESLDRVVGVKVDGALNIVRGIDPKPLKFAAFFSSVAGRFGNEGQSDYAAANEALSKLAVELDASWDARVVSMVWGPWAEIGMVSELAEHLHRRGLGLIDPRAGGTRLAEELIHGRQGEVEVIIADALGCLSDTIATRSPR
jgi:NAD(P)-dependent dehydrogenase (short-subunit alcohol dehydrogenase family)